MEATGGDVVEPVADVEVAERQRDDGVAAMAGVDVHDAAVHVADRRGQAGHPAGPTRPRAADAFQLVVASTEREQAGIGGKSITVTRVWPGDCKTSTTRQSPTPSRREQ